MMISFSGVTARTWGGEWHEFRANAYTTAWTNITASGYKNDIVIRISGAAGPGYLIYRRGWLGEIPCSNWLCRGTCFVTLCLLCTCVSYIRPVIKLVSWAWQVCLRVWHRSESRSLITRGPLSGKLGFSKIPKPFALPFSLYTTFLFIYIFLFLLFLIW
jgi:hypothetical protein